MTQMTQLTFEPTTGDVMVKSIIRTRYGKKAVLVGDTYDILSSHGENLADELDWQDTHCSFDRGVGEWTIDHDDVDQLAEVLEAHDYELTTDDWVDEMIADIREAAGIDADIRRWVPLGIEVEVDYLAKKSEKPMSKAGIVTGADGGQLYFRRDDGRSNRVESGGIYSSGHYPYMGEITEVRVAVPTGEADAEAETEASA